jgi:hypothetical protein
MYPEWMTMVTVLRKAYKADTSGTLVTFIALVVGCLGLIGAEWTTAAIFLPVAAVMAVGVRREMGPETERSVKWSRRASLAAGAAFLAVAGASASTGNWHLVVIGALAGALGLNNFRIERQKRRSDGSMSPG